MMQLLTTCAGCAAPLAPVAKQCSRCKTRYCGSACQIRHWEEGHKDLCKQIKRGGGAERYFASQKYEEAKTEAVEECAEDTKGQTCYICMEGVQRRHAPDEGLVRACACRGTAGVAHLSCLIRMASVRENDDIGVRGTWCQWHTCHTCKSKFHGGMACALGWAFWKHSLDETKDDPTDVVPAATITRIDRALGTLCGGLFEKGRHEDVIAVGKVHLEWVQRYKPDDRVGIIRIRSNLASCHGSLGQHELALAMGRDVYAMHVFNQSPMDEICHAAYTLAQHLVETEKYDEARLLVQERLPDVMKLEHVEGPEFNLQFRRLTGLIEYLTGEDAQKARAVDFLKRVLESSCQHLGEGHPLTLTIQHTLYGVVNGYYPGDEGNRSTDGEFTYALGTYVKQLAKAPNVKLVEVQNPVQITRDAGPAPRDRSSRPARE